MSLTNREIGKIIRKYRKHVQLTGLQLGDSAGISQSKISKIESGLYTRLQYAEIEKILNILRMPVIISQQILRSIGSGDNAESLLLYRYFSKDTPLDESSARTIRIYCGSTLPALVQTIPFRKAYIVINGGLPDIQDDLKRLAQRQDMLWEGTKKYSMLMPETVLYTSFATQTIHRAQLDRLERVAANPNVRIGIIPLKAGAAAAEYGPFAIYDERLAVNALVTGEIRTTGKQDVAAHLEVFEHLERMACYGEEAIALIRRAANSFA